MLQTSNLGATAPIPSEAPAASPVKAFPLTALLPQKWASSSTGERVRVQGSPGMAVVYVSVDCHVLAIPLDIAYQVGSALAEHAAEAQVRTMDYLRSQA